MATLSRPIVPMQDPVSLDQEVRESLHAIRRHRSRKLALAIGLLVLAAIAGVAFVSLTYLSTPELEAPAASP
jgi:hypothetical protein